MKIKICTVCKDPKKLSEFYPDARVKCGREPRCKKCSVARVMLWRRKNPLKTRDYSTRAKVKEYGLTLEAYKLLELKQKNVCAICKRAPKQRRLAVDHDHATGVVRELLCDRCNMVLGMVSDSMELLSTMYLYLQSHQTENTTNTVTTEDSNQ